MSEDMHLTDPESKEPVVFERDGKLFANSRDVAAHFGKRHDNVLRDIANLSCSARFRALNFEETEAKVKAGAAERAIRTVDMTKDGFAFLVMGFTGAEAGEFKERYINRFNAMESALKSRAAGFAIPQTLSEALRLAADQADTIEKQKMQIEATKPVVEAFDRIANADGSLSITEAAKTLQCTRIKDLTAWLHAQKWIYRRLGNKNWLAHQDKLRAGLLKHKISTVPDAVNGGEKVVEQVRVTPAGLAHLAKKLGGNSAPLLEG